MKLFSRTSLVAFGTAAALGVTSLTAPAFAEENVPAAETVAEVNTEATPLDDAADDLSTIELKPAKEVKGTAGTAITPITIEVAHGIADTFKADESKPLPEGLSIDNKGVISGVPKSKTSGTATIIATDLLGNTDSVTVTFNIQANADEKETGSSSDNIGDWIKIITAVIGALTTVLTFASRLDTFMK